MERNPFDANAIYKLINSAVAGLLLFSVNFAVAQTPFYQGKTITMIASRAPGGTGDLRDKLLMPFLRKYIPGNPNIVMDYMDGAAAAKRPTSCTAAPGRTA